MKIDSVTSQKPKPQPWSENDPQPSTSKEASKSEKAPMSHQQSSSGSGGFAVSRIFLAFLVDLRFRNSPNVIIMLLLYPKSLLTKHS